MTIRLAALAIALVVSSGSSGLAGQVYFDWNKKEPRLPACDATAVQSAVRRTVARADDEYSRGLSIESVVHIAQTGYVKDRPSPLARRYCRADAHLNQSGVTHPRKHKLYYMIEEYQAFAGIGWNVEVCVSGHDRWRVYDAWCRTVRP